MRGLLAPEHLILILIIAILFFGGKKIPELMRGIGKGMKEFKDAQKDDPAPPSNPPADHS